MIDAVIILILVVIVALACRHIYKEKKKGKCIGCPYSGCESCNCKTK